MYFDGPDPFRGIRKQILMSYGFTPWRAEQMLDDKMLSNNRWTPLRYQVAQMIDQARDGDAQAQEELRYFKQLFPGVRQDDPKQVQPQLTIMKPVAPGHVLNTKRVGTEARHRTLEWLQWAYAEGCLDDADFDARQAAAMKAQTQPELDVLVTDLPNEMPAAAPAPVKAGPVKPTPANLFWLANMLIWPVLGAFTVLVMVGLPAFPAGVAAALLGNALALIRQMVVHRRVAR